MKAQNSSLYIDRLKELKEIYDSGQNITSHLRQFQGIDHNSNEIIEIAYDLQAGSYIELVKANPSFNFDYTTSIAKIINGLEYKNLMEVGVGEATTLANVVEKLSNKNAQVFGFDISWSRISKAKQYCSEKNLKRSFLFTGDLFHMPIQDNGIDIVYTSHSIEPNGGREKEALQELYRVTNKYLILLEPGYEFASEEAKARMERLGYVKRLKEVALELGYQVKEHRLFDHSSNPLNPTALLIIEKNDKQASKPNPLACPHTGAILEEVVDMNCYYAPEAFLAYPILGQIPCLLPSNAVVASKLNDN